MKKYLPIVAAGLHLILSIILIWFVIMTGAVHSLFSSSFSVGWLFIPLVSFFVSIFSFTKTYRNSRFLILYNYSALAAAVLAAGIYGLVRFDKSVRQREEDKEHYEKLMQWQEKQLKSPRVLLEMKDTAGVQQIFLYDENHLEGKEIKIKLSPGVMDLSSAFTPEVIQSRNCSVIGVIQNGQTFFSERLFIRTYSDIYIIYQNGRMVEQVLNEEFH